MPDFSKVPFNILHDSEFVPFSTHNAGEVTLLLLSDGGKVQF